MSKTSKTPELPEQYQMLTRPDKKRSLRKVVIDPLRKLHVFADEQIPIPPEIEIDAEFKHFDDFCSRGKQTILAYHAEFLGFEAPKKQDIITTAMWVWAKFVADAAPHLANTDPVTGEKERKSSILQSVYTRGDKKIADVALNTYQAKQCYVIFDQLIGTGASVTEEQLRRKVEERAAELKTKQDPWRIFQYYRPKLISLGLMRRS